VAKQNSSREGAFRRRWRTSHSVAAVVFLGMPKRPRRPRDPNELAFQVFKEAIGEAAPAPAKPEKEKNPAAVALGKLGGVKGGKARAAGMTAEERAASARKAAEARWRK